MKFYRSIMSHTRLTATEWESFEVKNSKEKIDLGLEDTDEESCEELEEGQEAIEEVSQSKGKL